MGWAARRRFMILLLVGGVFAAFITVVLISVLAKTPSCTDGTQNQDESGIDCGGSCAYLCTAEMRPPVVLFTKVLPNGAGRTDAIASIENINATAAAKNVPYIITLYGANQVFVQEVTGTIDLPPSSTVPVFVPGISTGNQKVLRAFLTVATDAPRWFTMANNPDLKPVVSNTLVGGATTTPRVDAVFDNPSITALTDVPAVIFVHDEQGEIIAASKTIVPNIPAQGRSTATFTWNTAFTHPPAMFEVIPVVVLP